MTALRRRLKQGVDVGRCVSSDTICWSTWINLSRDSQLERYPELGPPGFDMTAPEADPAP